MSHQYVTKDDLFKMYQNCSKDVQSTAVHLLHTLSPNTNQDDLIEKAIEIVQIHAQKKTGEYEQWRKTRSNFRHELFPNHVPIDDLLHSIEQSAESRKRKNTTSTEAFHHLMARQKRYKTKENVEHLKEAAAQNNLSINEFLRYTLYRCNYNENGNDESNRQLALAGKILLEQRNLSMMPKLSVDETITLHILT
ncbi:unnamed protein product [Didymodactylos carnosus]|uniref:Uncharacterized protein n=1 Tax=Didymodactylos carnosus TaxID=1234261 RepID=A0A815XS22_9BILA|nr:unnamed protein product [Didymodactylos carnosus]CAF4423220.1 unnamed protein product [Didymodactylos carnosus]